MKKFIFTIITLSLFSGLLSGCSSNNNINNRVNQEEQLSSEVDKLHLEISDLEAQLAAAEASVSGQKSYISELTEQLAECQTLMSDTDSDSDGNASSDTSYKNKYPDLYASKAYDNKDSISDKTVYLTFDDGPSYLTPQVLDLLDQYNAKATFFVVYKAEAKNTEYLSEIVARGHTLALHSYSHDYNKIYESVDAFLSDFEKVYDWVYEETGQRPTLFRFPGGSAKGERKITDAIITEMERRGFIYYDWNVSSGDGSDLTETDMIISNICDNVAFFENPVVLMHDAPGKQATFEALPTVLETLHGKGYAFESLDDALEPVHFSRN